MLSNKDHNRRMTTGKRAFVAYGAGCVILVLFVMLTTCAGSCTEDIRTIAAITIKGFPFVYLIYQTNSFLINRKAMEKGFIKDYNEKKKLY